MNEQTHRQMVDDAINIMDDNLRCTQQRSESIKRLREGGKLASQISEWHAVGLILAAEVRRLRSEIEQLTIKQKEQHAED